VAVGYRGVYVEALVFRSASKVMSNDM
jgi:hypothetical protein